MELPPSKNYYESLEIIKNIWQADKKANFYYKEFIRYDAIIKRIPKTAQQILDLGCGDGFLSCRMAEKGFNVTSVDLSVNRLLRFKEQAERLHICQMESDIAKVNCPSESFDLIVCSEVIEHLPNYRHVLSEAFRLLKKDGFFMVTVPNNEKLKMLTCPHCLKVFYRDDHVNSFTQRSLAADLKQTGFHIVETLVLYSKIFNQIQYHLKLPYGILVKACDRVLSAIFKKYTFHLLIRAQK